MTQESIKSFCYMALAVALSLSQGCRPHQAAETAKAVQTGLCFAKAAATKDTAKMIDCGYAVLEDMRGPEEPATAWPSEQRRELAQAILPCVSKRIHAGTHEREAVRSCVEELRSDRGGSITTAPSPAPTFAAGPYLATPTATKQESPPRLQAELTIQFRKMARLDLRKDGELYSKDLRTNPTKWAPSPPLAAGSTNFPKPLSE